jgi:hypothetical protein
VGRWLIYQPLLLKWFCVFDYAVLLLPTYPLSLHRNSYKIFGLGSKIDMDFLAR